VPKGVSEIREILIANTLYRNKKVISREITDKLLIGKVEENGFLVIASSKIGVLCILDGRFKNENAGETVIEIETKIQKVFLILFNVWAILMGMVVIIGLVIPPNKPFSVGPIITLLIAAFFFRFLLFRAYTFASNKGVKKIEMLLY
jgi:hypothetical protein